MRAANSVHVGIYRMSGGKFANEVANMPLLLLTTFGRKTGKPYTNPVAYIKDGADFLVAASTGGMDWHPGWYYNLKHNPQATIQIGSEVLNVKAVIQEGEERTRLYEKFKAASNNFVKYEKATSRVIPVIRLTPV
jgi:deazaflavin-dependent oxidoreductase (nitroreductase family)